MAPDIEAAVALIKDEKVLCFFYSAYDHKPCEGSRILWTNEIVITACRMPFPDL